MELHFQVFLRFIVDNRDSHSGSRLGVIRAADVVLGEGRLEIYEEEILKSAFAWLNKNLPTPTKVMESGKNHAISWFKDSANEPIERMWSIVAVLRENGILVDVVRTSNPGRILYEDEWQVFAAPMKDRNPSA